MQNKAKKLTNVVAAGALLISASFATMPSVAANEATVANEVGANEVYYEFANESTMEIYYGENIEPEVRADGTFLVDRTTGESEQLPESTTDQEGDLVNLNYTIEDDYVEVQVIDPLAVAAGAGPGEFTTQSWLQCSLGTAGGAGGGGLAGAGVGSAVPGIGTVAGAVVGGVSGAMTGAAASCFN
ncbi:Pathogenicity island protein [Paenalkalicoccus suaedae]|uniref:Pathogenicity island protein n=1 Tax=Paenalkalicoccus suaedae TaxID=2592382 RepID=A0A859FIC3_9BACI|nr:Pathogenicity island protein [Paenalkalicoccus suaedae]QKS72454.1 Pathogenicity island protein [Paenalkalicoccus suaedae]